jgi:hypothetical protein
VAVELPRRQKGAAMAETMQEYLRRKYLACKQLIGQQVRLHSYTSEKITMVTIIAVHGRWIKVQYPNGNQGTVDVDRLELPTAP